MKNRRLRESEAQYRTIVENLLQGIAIIQDGRFVLCNKALLTMSGYSWNETLEMNPQQLLNTIHPEDRTRALEAMENILGGGMPPPAQLLRLIHKNGTINWVEMLAASTVFLGRAALQLSYINRTEEIRTQTAYTSLIDRAVYGIAILQRGRIIFANQALADMCGYTVPELRSLSPAQLAEVIHEDDRARVLAHMADCETGQVAPQRQLIRFRHRGGGIRWAETQSVLADYQGASAIQVFYRDATAERAAEDQLAEAHLKMRNLAGHLIHVREEERRRMAQDIHDQLGQTLTAIKMDLHWVTKRLKPDDVSLKERLARTIVLGEEAIGAVQRLASYLRPRMLDDLGLAPALDWLCAEFRRQTKISCRATADIPPGVVGGNAATALYRIVQEALENVARHSHAEHVAVRLYCSPDSLTLQVEDDGDGITEAQADDPHAYGLIGMRERVEGLGGSFSISGETGFGTIIVIHVPLPSEGGLA